MGFIDNGKVHILGNFAEYTDKRPDDIMEDYKIMVPWEEHFSSWKRPKLGRVTCDCKMVKEHYMPYYGRTFFHSDECAIRKHLQKYPQIYNLIYYDPLLLAYDE